ncbi:hypothetical protein [Roseococcus sp. YIM B11640]|uniref:hypothetical protein n=1 Tax=Roseococcus sp. YIM B11640 TaxID=3133973 RepID=UPI003C79AAB4
MQREIANIMAACHMAGMRYVSFPPVDFDAVPAPVAPVAAEETLPPDPAAELAAEETGRINAPERQLPVSLHADPPLPQIAPEPPPPPPAPSMPAAARAPAVPPLPPALPEPSAAPVAARSGSGHPGLRRLSELAQEPREAPRGGQSYALLDEIRRELRPRRARTGRAPFRESDPS